MKTILAPIDFSPISRRVTDCAVKLARIFDARVILLNVVQLPMPVTNLAPLVGETLQFTAEVGREARARLQRLVHRLRERGVAAEMICEQGSPVSSIVGHAKKLEARYIVLGSHGRGALYDLVVGSTASGVIKRSPCPVVVIPENRTTKPKRPRSRAPQKKSSEAPLERDLSN